MKEIGFDYLDELHPKQQIAFTTIANEILYGGAAGGGKSALMRYLAVYCAFAVPGIQIYLFRRTFPDLEKNHIQGPQGLPTILSKYLADGTVRWNQAKGMFSFPGGGRIFLCHLQYDKDLASYQGAEIHLLLIDELTHFTEKMYRYLRGRVRIGSWKVPKAFKSVFPRILCGSNPGSIGHNWVKQTFVTYQPWMRIKKTARRDGGMLRQYIPAKLEDNPSMAENDPDYADRLQGLGDEALVKAMLDGDWDIVAGGAFDDVWKTNIHIIRPFEIPKNWRVNRSFDWGSSAPFSVGWWAKSNGEEVRMADGKTRTFFPGSMIRVNEWYGWNGSANQGLKMLAVDVAKGIKEREQSNSVLKNLIVRPGPADNSIYDEENGVCIARDMAGAGVKWTRSNKSAGSRLHGLEEARKMFRAATKTPVESPGIYIFDTCTEFIRTIPVLPRNEKNMDDIDTKAEDHIWDEFRYEILDIKYGIKSQEV